MFPPFPEQKAEKVLEALIEQIEAGNIEFKRISRESESRRNQGIALGALVAADSEGREFSFVTNSGISVYLAKMESEHSDTEVEFIKNTKIESERNFSVISTRSITETESERESNENSVRSLFRLNSEFQNSVVEYVQPIVPAEKIADALRENDSEIHEITRKIDSAPEDSAELKERRKILCARSLKNVHALYRFHCADGKIRTLAEIAGAHRKSKFLPESWLPPTGTGDCCGPKLLDRAFSLGLRPVSMCEIFYNNAENSGPKFAKVPPCDPRCGMLLPQMLGIEIVFIDDSLCVVEKPSGLLSVPGRITTDSVERRFRNLFPDSPKQPAVHRLDMETSGLMILARTLDAQRALQREFERGEVEKEYVALLDGNLIKKGIGRSGRMELFFRLDVENRPRQVWDAQNGKKAVTEWKIEGVERFRQADGNFRTATRVSFFPKTGRTHQLRLAAADPHGFGVPIIGDTLYGTPREGERLMLHARKIRFRHPATGETVEISSEYPF